MGVNEQERVRSGNMDNLVLEVKEFPVNKTNKGPFELAGKLEKGI